MNEDSQPPKTIRVSSSSDNLMLACAMCALLISACVYAGDYSGAQNAKAWPVVVGTIKSTDKHYGRHNDWTEYQYSYSVDGRSYTSNDVGYHSPKGPIFSSETTSFAVGDHANVHYNPKNCSDAFIASGIPQTFALDCILFSALIVLFTGLSGHPLITGFLKGLLLLGALACVLYLAYIIYVDKSFLNNVSADLPWSLSLSDDPKEQITACNVQIKKHPNDAEAFSIRAAALHNLSKNTEALRDYAKAISLDPKDGNNYYERACIYNELGQYKQALTNANKSIELQADDSSNFAERGDIEYALNEYKAAAQDYNRVTELSPDDSRGWIGRANAAYMQAKYKQAIQAYDKAIKLDSGEAESYYFRAMSEEALGEKAAAARDKKEATLLGYKPTQ